MIEETHTYVDVDASSRVRDAKAQRKIDELQGLLALAANDDLDAIFTSVVRTMKSLGFSIAAEPEVLLLQLNKG